MLSVFPVIEDMPETLNEGGGGSNVGLQYVFNVPTTGRNVFTQEGNQGTYCAK